MKTCLSLEAVTMDDEKRVEAALRADDMLLALKSLFNNLEKLERTLATHEMDCAAYIRDVKIAFENTLVSLELMHLVK